MKQFRSEQRRPAMPANGSLVTRDDDNEEEEEEAEGEKKEEINDRHPHRAILRQCNEPKCVLAVVKSEIVLDALVCRSRK